MVSTSGRSNYVLIVDVRSELTYTFPILVSALACHGSQQSSCNRLSTLTSACCCCSPTLNCFCPYFDLDLLSDVEQEGEDESPIFSPFATIILPWQQTLKQRGRMLQFFIVSGDLTAQFPIAKLSKFSSMFVYIQQLFKSNQRNLYEELNGKASNRKNTQVPKAKEALNFLSEIWSKP